MPLEESRLPGYYLIEDALDWENLTTDNGICPASEGETAVTARARSGPSVSWATQARNAESAPPLNATTTRSRAPRWSRRTERSPIGVLSRQ